MSLKRLLIANRGEIAVRIARAAVDLGIETVAVYSEDDQRSLHTRIADQSVPLQGMGASAYLNIDNLVQAAKDTECDCVHPGYGFLAENADFAKAVEAAAMVFVGPTPDTLALFGNKAKARQVAQEIDVPVIGGSNEPVTVEEAQEIFQQLNGKPMILKAIAGGGGRGSRMVHQLEELEDAFNRAQSEANAAFGNPDLYVEALVEQARHIEVQIVGDGDGGVVHLFERECSTQRRHQKILEVAPAPNLDSDIRQQIIDAALRFAEKTNYRSLGTFEFLVHDDRYSFIETNARLQVEHTVTEEVTGIDLVQTQLQIAAGATLSDLGLSQPPGTQGFAVQARVNMEKIDKDGTVLPTSGTLKAYDPPSGPGVRTDGFGYTGYATSSLYDSLLAKIITRGATMQAATARCERALSEFRIDGLETNIPFLGEILAHKDFVDGKITTRWVDENTSVIVEGVNGLHQRFVQSEEETEDGAGFAGARVDTSDPLALFAHDAQVKASATEPTKGNLPSADTPEGVTGLSSPIQGTIVSVDVAIGEEVVEGQQVAVVEAMKMEHVIKSEHNGVVRDVTMAKGDVVREGYPIVYVEEAEISATRAQDVESIDPDYIRPDLELTYERHAYIYDENREEAVAKRYGRGYRMPRENISQLMDPGSFKEYWPLIVARQHTRHDMETLRKNTPADGLIAGIGTVNAGLFGEEDARTMIVHYDYTVLAGTQGGRNHYKQDRMFELANRFRIPLVLFGEGGGGRPGDDGKGPGVAFDTHTFTQFSKLSG